VRSRARPRVSIGLAVYNGARFLAETIESHLDQTYQDFELIIADNASTDESGDIARRYAARDRRVRYERSDVNIGAAANYRRAFRLARAPFFRWSAADDLFAPDSLARCVEILEGEPRVVLTYPRTKLIDERGVVLREYEDGLNLRSPSPSERFTALLHRIGYVNAIYGLIRSAAMRDARGMGDYVGSDIVFQAELALYGSFWEIPDFLFFRRMHAAASSSMSAAERNQFYHPQAPRTISMRRWRHLWELARAVERAPIPFHEKARIEGWLALDAARGRGALWTEIVNAVRDARPRPSNARAVP